GAVCHTLNLRLTAEHLARMVERSQARIVIVSADLIGLAQQIAERVPQPLRLMVIDGPATGEAEALEPLIAGAGDGFAWGGFDETAPCGLCFTSGTTGAPKGVTYTHRASYLHTLRLLQVDTLAISGWDVVLAMVPMFHANAWGLPFATPAVGAKLVLPGRNADGASLARLIQSEDVTVAVGVPTVWLGLLEHLEATGERVPSLKRIVVGGAPTPPALMARLEAGLGVIVQTTWGMTELTPVGTVMPISAARSPAQSGRPAVGVDLMVADSDGQPLPEQRNTEGHLHVRGAAVIERYFEEAAPAVSAEGWFATGDLARIDDEGNLSITGRAKDLIKSGGEWINPAEIEAIVSASPQVALAAVIGRPDPKWSERPILVVELRDRDVTDADLLALLKGKVASWWVPDEIVRLDSMPIAATGKIDKLRLRALYGAASAA
ncbi:MAG TPA: AMP-binding protein, partial [Phenylobacterium sp.]|nr:AMP-binding protein [Phenylobacterium sp.]